MDRMDRKQRCWYVGWSLDLRYASGSISLRESIFGRNIEPAVTCLLFSGYENKWSEKEALIVQTVTIWDQN